MTNGTCHSAQIIAAAKVVRRGPVRNEYPQEQPGPPANLFKTREAGCGRQTVPSRMSVTGGITGWRSTRVSSSANGAAITGINTSPANAISTMTMTTIVMRRSDGERGDKPQPGEGLRDHGQGTLRIFRTILGLCATAVAILYFFDFVSAKYAIPGNRQVYADVTISRYWAIKEKGNKIEYSPADPVVERCVYAVFPHFGYTPCWYLMRHTRRAIEVGAVEPEAPSLPVGLVGAGWPSGRRINRREIARMGVTPRRYRTQPLFRR